MVLASLLPHLLLARVFSLFFAGSYLLLHMESMRMSSRTLAHSIAITYNVGSKPA